jgi:hypothetical protein
VTDREAIRVPNRADLPSYRTLLVDIDRDVATVTLNRPLASMCASGR